MAEVVESPINDPQSPPEASEAQALIQDLVRRLGERHGQDYIASLALLVNPMDPKLDRADVCTVEMYKEALKLSDPPRGKLLRHMFGAKPT